MRRMASSTDQLLTTNPDLPRQPSVCSLSTLLAAEPSKSITMDDDDDLLLLKSIYSEPKTMDDVWKEMVTGTTTEPQHQNNSNDSEMTLEDFLSDSKALPVGLPVLDHNVSTNGSAQPVVGVSQPHEAQAQAQGGRGKRRRGAGGAAMAVAVEEAVVDKATLQKQRRMIKNRESAARSRERKQAYTVELEAMVVHLEEEHARLLREEADRNRQRYKQLMECLIPVAEKRKPRRKLLRVNSVQW